MDGDGDDAGGQLLAASASPRSEDALAVVRGHDRLPSTPSDGDDYDDLYGDVNVGFLPLLPLSPSPAPTSPPKTPSPGPGCFIQFPTMSPQHRAPTSPPKTPSPGPGRSIQLPPMSPQHRVPPPEPQREPEPEPRSTPAPRRDVAPQPQRPPGGGGASYSLPPRCTPLYISELLWWTTDAEVEAALAPHGAAAALYGLHFFAEKYTGKSRGICRADFLNPAAAASAAAGLHGHAFHGRHCVASLARPAALHRLGDDSDSHAEAVRVPGGLGKGGRGAGASDATEVRGNVGPASGDRPPLPVLPRPAPSPSFAGILGGVRGYGGFQSMGQYNAGMGNGMMPSALAHHVNPAFLAAGGMGMLGSGLWYDQRMSGGLWGAQQEWNFRGYQVPWQRPTPPTHHHQVQQQGGIGNGNYGKGRRQGPSNRREERSIGNVGYLNRRQADHDGGDRYKENDCEKGRHQEHVLEKERVRERHWNQGDQRGDGGDKRRHQEYAEHADFDRRGRARSKSQPWDDGDDDHPRKRR